MREGVQVGRPVRVRLAGWLLAVCAFSLTSAGSGATMRAATATTATQVALTAVAPSVGSGLSLTGGGPPVPDGSIKPVDWTAFQAPSGDTLSWAYPPLLTNSGDLVGLVQAKRSAQGGAGAAEAWEVAEVGPNGRPIWRWAVTPSRSLSAPVWTGADYAFVSAEPSSNASSAPGPAVSAYIVMLSPTGQPVARAPVAVPAGFSITRVAPMASGFALGLRGSFDQTELMAVNWEGSPLWTPGPWVGWPNIKAMAAAGGTVEVLLSVASSPTLLGVDVATGVTRWNTTLGTSRAATLEGIGVSGTSVWLDGSRLEAISSATGAILWRRPSTAEDSVIVGPRSYLSCLRVVCQLRSLDTGKLIAKNLLKPFGRYAAVTPIAMSSRYAVLDVTQAGGARKAESLVVSLEGETYHHAYGPASPGRSYSLPAGGWTVALSDIGTYRVTAWSWPGRGPSARTQAPAPLTAAAPSVGAGVSLTAGGPPVPDPSIKQVDWSAFQPPCGARLSWTFPPLLTSGGGLVGLVQTSCNPMNGSPGATDSWAVVEVGPNGKSLWQWTVSPPSALSAPAWTGSGYASVVTGSSASADPAAGLPAPPYILLWSSGGALVAREPIALPTGFAIVRIEPIPSGFALWLTSGSGQAELMAVGWTGSALWTAGPWAGLPGVASLTVAGDTLEILLNGPPSPSLVGLSVTTGATLWKTPLRPNRLASLVGIGEAGTSMWWDGTHLTAISASTGAVLWSHEISVADSVIVGPTSYIGCTHNACQLGDIPTGRVVSGNLLAPFGDYTSGDPIAMSGQYAIFIVTPTRGVLKPESLVVSLQGAKYDHTYGVTGSGLTYNLPNGGRTLVIGEAAPVAVATWSWPTSG